MMDEQFVRLVPTDTHMYVTLNGIASVKGIITDLRGDTTTPVTLKRTVIKSPVAVVTTAPCKTGML